MATATDNSNLSFLPDDYLANKARRRANSICAALLGVSLLGLGAAWFVADHALSTTRTEHDAITQQFELESLRLKQVEQLQKQQQYLSRQAELTDALIERVPRSVILAELTNGLPKGVSLTDFNLDSQLRPVVQPPPTAKNAVAQRKANEKNAVVNSDLQPRLYNVVLKIQGIAQNDVQVADFIGQLNQSPLLDEVNLSFSQTKPIQQQPLRQFSIEARLKRDANVSARKNVTATHLSNIGE
jgi:Tfp pilus assembly protein PilN